MQTLKAILIDDEKNSLESLRLELNSYCPEIVITGAYRDPHKGREALINEKPDVLFLDIEMPTINGFDLLLHLPSIEFDVVFVTAYDQFALKAFDFNAIDYLLKPIRKEKLLQAVQKVKNHQIEKLAKGNLQALIHNILIQTNHGHEHIALPTNDGFSIIEIADIIYLEANSNYTWIKLTNQHRMLVSKSLGEIEKLLPASVFCRIHKTFLINTHHLERYIRGQGGTLVMKDSTQLPVSRSHKEQLLNMILKRNPGWF